MKALNVKPVHLAFAAGAVVLAYVLLRGARGAASDVAGGVVNAAGGVVEGLGLGLGLPVTDAGRCAQAKREGSLLGQSLYCDAGPFMWSLPGNAVLEVGDALGVPRTDASRCEQAKAAGDAWGASTACTAGDYLSWQWERVWK